MTLQVHKIRSSVAQKKLTKAYEISFVSDTLRQGEKINDKGALFAANNLLGLCNVQPLIYVPFFNRVSGAGGFMFRAWWGRM